MTRRKRSGMTLLEVVVALATSFVVVTLGAGLLGQIQGAGDRIRRSSTDIAREGNGDRDLRDALSQAAVSSDTTRQFRGDSRSLECWTWCLTPRGYESRCAATVTVDSLGDSTIVSMQLNGAGTITVRRQIGHAQLRYINESRSDSSWRAYWQTSASLPVAVAIVTRTDTTIYPVGPARD